MNFLLRTRDVNPGDKAVLKMKSSQGRRAFYVFTRRRALMAVCFAIFITAIFPGSEALAAIDVQNDCKNGETEDLCARRGGYKAIYIFDEIDAEVEKTINHLNNIIPIEAPFPIVYVNSRGGSLQAGIGIGRTLRLRKASVKNRDLFRPENESECAPACVLVAAGATRRNLTHIALHQAHKKKRMRGERYEITQIADSGQEIIYNYFTEMGFNDEIIKIIKDTPYDKITHINYDFNRPFAGQKIVQLGFRMDVPDESETVEARKRKLKIDADGVDGLKNMVDLGSSEAAYLLGHRMFYGLEGYQKNTKEGLIWLNKAADLGNAVALHNLGFIYSEGIENVTKDRKLAVQYFLRAAKLGLAASQNNLAWHYYTGDGVEKNIAEAIFWVTRAVEQGESFAYGSLGTMRLEGNGFVPDDVETCKWFLLAAATMPEGKTKDDEMARLKLVEGRLSAEQISLATKLAKEWVPLRQRPGATLDKDDR